MTEAPKKKNLWQLLNTPVKDLVKKEADKSTDATVIEKSPDQPITKASVSSPAQELLLETGPFSKAITQELNPNVLEPLAEIATEPKQTSELETDNAPESETTLPESEAVSSPQAMVEGPVQEDPQGETIQEPADEPVKVSAKPEPVAVDAVSVEEVVSTTQAESLETAMTVTETTAEAQKRKKSLWEILNTPVQDLFKEGQLDLEDSNESDVAFLGLGKDKPQLEGKEKESWLSHFRQRLSRTRQQFADNITRLAKGRTKVDEEMLEELEEILLQSDVGVKTTDDVLEHLRQQAKQRRFLPEEVLPSLTAFLEKTLESEAFVVEPGKLNIFLIVGVNGTGKTTTVGKIAAKLKISGYKVMIAAGDTFRAAAIDQLSVWGKRVGCQVIQHHDGADAAAVVYDAIQSARAKNMDALLIDTAGRLHNKDHLMEELKKVHRIIEREKQDARVECILVLDATTGQNGLRQAEVFSKSVPLDSLILTKLDGTAKGGVIFGIKRELGIPIKLLGVGEHLGDLQEFDPKSFVQALFAQEDEAESLV